MRVAVVGESSLGGVAPGNPVGTAAGLLSTGDGLAGLLVGCLRTGDGLRLLRWTVGCFLRTGDGLRLRLRRAAGFLRTGDGLLLGLRLRRRSREGERRS